MDTFSQICSILAGRRGKQAAITLADLADLVGTSRRQAEEIIEQQLMDFPWPVIAGATGVFIPTEANDINAYIHNLHSRHQKLKVREETVIHKVRLAGWPEDSTGYFTDRRIQQELF